MSCCYKHISVCLNVLQVAACHCRVHETYKRCFPSAAPLLPCKVTHLEEIVKPCRCELLNCLILHLLLFFSCSSYYLFLIFCFIFLTFLNFLFTFFLPYFLSNYLVFCLICLHLPSPLAYCFFDLLPLYSHSVSSTSHLFPLISSLHHNSVPSAFCFLTVPSYHIQPLSATPHTYFNHKPPL